MIIVPTMVTDDALRGVTAIHHATHSLLQQQEGVCQL